MDDGALPTTGGQFSPGATDTFIVLGIILAVTLAALIWALVFHTRKSPHRRRRHHHHPGGHNAEPRKATAGLKELLEKHRRHRHKHRALNPTLAETGGLPPARAEEPPPPEP